MENALRPRNYERMGYTLRQYYDRLGEYQAPLVKEKILLEKELEPEEYDLCFNELKKFVALCRHSGKPIAMTSEKIDAVWHQFILFTREYRDFSNQFFGGYLHHSPNVPSRPGDPSLLENLVTEYERTFGDIPKIWNITKR